jgi:AcrR family transcriptional regulator
MSMPQKQPENINQETKKHIIEVARRLFSEYSYLGVSMSDIAKKLNITKAALYYHFTSKAEIYKKVLDEVFDSLNLRISGALSEKSPDRKIHKLIRNYLDFGLKEKNLIKALMLKLSPADPQIREHIIKLRKRIANLIRPLVEEVMANRKLFPKADSALITSLLTNMMDGLLLEHSFLNKKIDLKKATNQIMTLLF